MPTTRGWLVAATGAISLTIGRIFGAPPLEQLGFGLVVLVLLAAAVVLLGRHELGVTRTLTPQRVVAGRPVNVSLELTNDGRGPAPLVLLQETLPAGVAGSARFALHGVEPGGTRRAGFNLKTSRRGRYEIGPLELSFVDPFGLARLTSVSRKKDSFLVHPRIEPLALPRDLGERRSVTAAALRQPTGARGEDFYTLREYIEGDDLRRIHWPSTAKRARYMIRQEETPWHTRATIVIDDGDGRHGGVGEDSSFERAVEAAAALVDLYHRSAYGFRLAAAHHAGVPTSKGTDHRNHCLDLLAEIDLARDRRGQGLLARLAEIESTAAAEAALIVVTGTLSSDTVVGLSRCRRRFRQVTAVCFPAHRFVASSTKSRWEKERETLEATRLLERSAGRAVVLGPHDSLASAWATLSSTRSPRGERKWGQKPELV